MGAHHCRTSALGLCAIVVALVLVCTLTTQASIIQFDPDGAGGDAPINVGVFDFVPGNTLLKGVGNITTTKSNQSITYLKQTRLGNFIDGTGHPITTTNLNVNSANGYEITVVMGRSANASVSGSTLSIAEAGNDTNYFKIYYDPARNANDLAGTGFDDGTLILAGAVTQLNSGAVVLPDVVPFDAYLNDDYPGKTSLHTVGGLDVKVSVGYANSNFFAVLPPQLQFVLDNGSTTTPFSTVNPAASFTNGSGGSILPNLWNGSPTDRNGLGTDFQVQNDTNSTMVLNGEQVPEPSTLVLGCLGVLGLITVARRRYATPRSA